MGELAFKALLEKLSRKITLFRPDGTPARATLNVSFREYQTLAELVNDPRLESADKTKRRVVVGSDSLWAMAGREYGDVTLWSEIAQEYTPTSIIRATSSPAIGSRYPQWSLANGS